MFLEIKCRHPRLLPDQLAGRHFQAMGVSLVIHPRNPHLPTSHATCVSLSQKKRGRILFGGLRGFDLTPFYPVRQDVEHWHQTAKDLCQPFAKMFTRDINSGVTSISIYRIAMRHAV